MKGTLSTPLVSVIIPNYNHARYLEKRLDSILNQTFQDFEIIIIDDCSTDTSVDFLKTFKSHPKVSHFIINEKNSGSPFAQWKKGIELAKGKFIWIAETDDFAELVFLEKTVLTLENNQDSNLVYADSTIVNDEGESTGLWSSIKNDRFKTTKWSNDYEISGRKEVIDFLLHSTTINNASAVLFRKKSLVNISFLNELAAYKTSGDLFTYIFVALQGKISYIAQPLNNYREHVLNVTKKNTKSGLLYIERIRCFEKALSQLEEIKFSKMELYNLKRGYKHILKKNGYRLIDLGFKKEVFQFINCMVQSKLISKNEGSFYALLFKMYALKHKALKKVMKKMIRKVL